MKKTNPAKRLFGILLALAPLISLLPIPAAQTADADIPSSWPNRNRPRGCYRNPDSGTHMAAASYGTDAQSVNSIEWQANYSSST